MTAEQQMRARILAGLRPSEKGILTPDPCLGAIPRLDAVARFLAEKGAKFARVALEKKTSSQPSVDECLISLVDTLLKRIGEYDAQG